jgi:hypothetical protein
MLFCGDVTVARRNILSRVPGGCPDWPDSDSASVQGHAVDATGAPVSGIAVAAAASSLSTRPIGSGGISGRDMLCTPLSRTARRCDSGRRQRDGYSYYDALQVNLNGRVGRDLGLM